MNSIISIAESTFDGVPEIFCSLFFNAANSISENPLNVSFLKRYSNANDRMSAARPVPEQITTGTCSLRLFLASIKTS
ncbi:unnamed protein product [Schistosoma curassoni]|uniref:Uncharacterized protein n=1 Tax=Schistosoma curassoni TaxID=6186 RepID=A0A183KW21_9TREM|nr:unnamed protein product [Schistosoma curassoni]